MDWSRAAPMNNEENMLANLKAYKAVRPGGIGWLYRWVLGSEGALLRTRGGAPAAARRS